MANYDFKNLSPIDFEILARDLLQAELNLSLETFKAGRDGGIDFRYSQNSKATIIVQCKHYAETGYSGLKSTLKREELPKIARIKPNRYILVTSVDLTVRQKNELFKTLQPYIQNTGDLIGKGDLNNLLGKHQAIERKTFKLWFTSVAVFEEILNSNVINISRDALEEIKHKSTIYVQNDSFSEAIEILKTNNFCIVAGAPGIGKTTLAEMLLLHFLDLKYDIVKISADIREATSLNYHRTKRAFYYDDFLGQTSFAEKLGKNEDQRIIDFIKHIRRSKVAKLILTTREYILNQTKIKYEKFDREDFHLATCIVDLSKYSRLNRAKILYNHIYFSNISIDHKSALFEDNKYLKIIDHSNYNPRIIQLLTDPARMVGVDAAVYFEHFMNSLSDPVSIWRHAFEEQLSTSAKNLLIVMASMPPKMDIDYLESAFKAYHKNSAKYFGHKHENEDFRRALKELDGDFTKTTSGYAGRITIIFHNPSIKDFLMNYLVRNQNLVLSIIKSSIYFDQLMRLWKHSLPNVSNRTFEPLILENIDTFTEAMTSTIHSNSVGEHGYESKRHSYTYYGETYLESKIQFISKIAGIINHPPLKLFLDQLLKEEIHNLKNRKGNRRELTGMLEDLEELEGISINTLDELKISVKDFLMSRLFYTDDYEHVLDYKDLYPDLIDDYELSIIKDGLEEIEPSDTQNPDNIRDEAHQLYELADRLGIDLEQKLDDFEDIASDLESQVPSDDDNWDGTTDSSGDTEASDTEIKSVFSTLFMPK